MPETSVIITNTINDQEIGTLDTSNDASNLCTTIRSESSVSCPTSGLFNITFAKHRFDRAEMEWEALNPI